MEQNKVFYSWPCAEANECEAYKARGDQPLANFCRNHCEHCPDCVVRETPFPKEQTINVVDKDESAAGLKLTVFDKSENKVIFELDDSPGVFLSALTPDGSVNTFAVGNNVEGKDLLRLLQIAETKVHKFLLDFLAENFVIGGDEE